jgi:5-methylcytosine-specific restriction endonuclease McrA
VDLAPEIGPLQKRCSRCGEVRPLGWFLRKGDGRLRSECRECGRGWRSEAAARRRSRMAVNRERVTERDLLAIGDAQNWRCACGCGRVIRYEWTVDHRVPLARGGTHTRSNIQLMAGVCNSRKGAR